MSLIKRIIIIGSSVGLRVRPSIAEGGERLRTYGELLQSNVFSGQDANLVFVDNLSASRLLVGEVLYSLDEYIRYFPDVIVLNVGAVDAPNRDIPLWFSDVVFKRKFHFAHGISTRIYKSSLFKKISPKLVKIRGYSSWTKHIDFALKVEEIIYKLQKETHAKIIVLGINSGNVRIDVRLPGTVEKYVIYNKTLNEVSSKMGVSFVDVSDLTSSAHFPDGVHYNGEGHKVIAERIARLL